MMDTGKELMEGACQLGGADKSNDQFTQLFLWNVKIVVEYKSNGTMKAVTLKGIYLKKSYYF